MDAGCLSAASVFRKNARKKGEEIDIGAMGLSIGTGFDPVPPLADLINYTKCGMF
jgi:hypothetical protein